MMMVEKEVNRVLTLLRNKIREKGFTQLQVQEALSWGRSYISQLLTKQKSLRVEQVLLILDVIGTDPADFFAELYYVPGPGYPREARALGAAPYGRPDGSSEVEGEFDEMRSLVRGLVWLLIDKELIDVDELTTSVKSRKDGPLADLGPDEPTN